MIVSLFIWFCLEPHTMKYESAVSSLASPQSPHLLSLSASKFPRQALSFCCQLLWWEFEAWFSLSPSQSLDILCKGRLHNLQSSTICTSGRTWAPSSIILDASGELFWFLLRASIHLHDVLANYEFMHDLCLAWMNLFISVTLSCLWVTTWPEREIHWLYALIVVISRVTSKITEIITWLQVIHDRKDNLTLQMVEILKHQCCWFQTLVDLGARDSRMELKSRWRFHLRSSRSMSSSRYVSGQEWSCSQRNTHHNALLMPQRTSDSAYSDVRYFLQHSTAQRYNHKILTFYSLWKWN